ncbi:MAG: aspartate-semialdehyde dehydrogenase, partial [Betaproteobacteria bacterium]|nr:aspartate-semialdehyde dehydrogenase [Betaproteobacteria bacterium]
MNKVGVIGWRGMVGSVLVSRMRDEGDFELIDPTFFSTQLGLKAPEIGKPTGPVKDSNDIAELKAMDILISCQGSDYTTEIYPKLRAAGW